MFYQFGKTSQKIRFDKDNRLSLDTTFFLEKNFFYNDFDLNSIEENQNFYVTKNEDFFIDNITIKNPNKSDFYSRKQMIFWDKNLTLCSVFDNTEQNFKTKLVFATEEYNFNKFFIRSFDFTNEVPTFITTENFSSSLVDFFDDNNEKIKISPLQFIFLTPILKIKLEDILYDNHIFILSKFGEIKKEYKLYIIKSFNPNQ